MLQRTANAFVWRLVSESSKFALQMGVQVTLARLLPVEAFGVLAIASLLINFGFCMAEIGTGPALIQRAEITAKHVRVAWSLSVMCGALVSLGIWMGAPVIAALFRADAAAPVLRLIGLVFVIGSAGTTAESLLQRRMDYRRLLCVELLSYGCGYAVLGITLAALNYGVWALAWGTVAQSTLKTSLLLLLSPHSLRPCLARAEAGQLLNFGVGMTLGRLASFSAQNADYFVVARWLGTTALGFYSRAYQLMCLPIYQFSSILNYVLFPAYSSIQTEPDRLRRGYLGSVCLASLVVFPALTTMAIVAPELMITMFGPQWAPAAPALRILCVHLQPGRLAVARESRGVPEVPQSDRLRHRGARRRLRRQPLGHERRRGRGDRGNRAGLSADVQSEPPAHGSQMGDVLLGAASRCRGLERGRDRRHCRGRGPARRRRGANRRARCDRHRMRGCDGRCRADRAARLARADRA
jgi:PST family polysaccharide transporter